MKRIVTVQDISCVGKCSLTVALPIISAMGVETAVLPTAVLSAHTKYQNVHFRDLTGDLLPIARHWKQEGITFDGMYLGYLGSLEQVDIMRRLAEMFRREGVFLFLDPVMGDNGRLYTGFDGEFVEKMIQLCTCADMIAPNLTEACALTGTAYREDYDETFLRTLLKKLSALGAGVCVITGVALRPGQTGVAGYEKATDTYYHYTRDKVPMNCHGTGDVFCSVCVGAMLRGSSWQEAVRMAADFTAECVDITMQEDRDHRLGVVFEKALPWLLEKI